MLSILHTQSRAHELIGMHTCLRAAQIYILRTRAKLATRPLSTVPDLKSHFCFFNASVSFSFSLFCKTVWFKNSRFVALIGGLFLALSKITLEITNEKMQGVARLLEGGISQSTQTE